MTDLCTIPPEGWWCSRTPGHSGPCAARPIEAPWEGQLTDAEQAMIDAAWETHKAAAPTVNETGTNDRDSDENPDTRQLRENPTITKPLKGQ